MIVVPLDTLELSENLLTSLGSLARSLRAELQLVHVLPDPFAVPHPPSEDAVLTQRARVTDRLEGLAAKLKRAGVAAHTVVREGVVQVEIVAVAELIHAELIVLPTRPPRAHGWLSRDGGGEHADLLDHSRVPVMLLQENVPALTDIHRILVPLDGSTAGDAILPVVAKLAVTTGACLVLVHVFANRQGESALGVRQHLSMRLAELRQAGCSAELHAVHANRDIGSAISEHAEATRADLIAMASRPREQFGGLTLGRAVESVRRGASVPLLLKNPRF